LTSRYHFDYSKTMEIKTSVEALAALAHESRLTVFRALVQRGPEGLKPGELAAACGIPDSTLSFHLAHLLRAGLVSRRRRGRTLIYAAEFATVNALIGYLMENCCAGSTQPVAASGCGPGACAPSEQSLPVAVGDLH
jgi:ArsR family transcriptional regulator, arsenate/arsenite/antimonite-responsive transcriptional repressor